MKKLIAVFLCMVMMATMIPSFFASAAAAPAAAGVQEVVAQNDDSGSDLYNALKGFIELWGGLFQLILGSEVAQGFLPALKQVLSLVSIKEFFSTIGSIWSDVTG